MARVVLYYCMYLYTYIEVSLCIYLHATSPTARRHAVSCRTGQYPIIIRVLCGLYYEIKIQSSRHNTFHALHLL